MFPVQVFLGIRFGFVRQAKVIRFGVEEDLSLEDEVVHIVEKANGKVIPAVPPRLEKQVRSTTSAKAAIRHFRGTVDGYLPLTAETDIRAFDGHPQATPLAAHGAMTNREVVSGKFGVHGDTATQAACVIAHVDGFRGRHTMLAGILLANNPFRVLNQPPLLPEQATSWLHDRQNHLPWPDFSKSPANKTH